MSSLDSPDTAAEAGRYAAAALMARQAGATDAQAVAAGALTAARILWFMAGKPEGGVAGYIDADSAVSVIVDRALDALTDAEMDAVLQTLDAHWDEINRSALALAGR